MRELTPETITDAVLDQMSTTPDPRMREIMAAAVKHLHAFAREGEADKTGGHVGSDPSAILKDAKVAPPAPAAS